MVMERVTSQWLSNEMHEECGGRMGYLFMRDLQQLMNECVVHVDASYVLRGILAEGLKEWSE